MRTLIPLLFLAACQNTPDAAPSEARILGACPDGVVDIPIGWDVVAVIAHGVYQDDAGDYYAAEVEIEDWDADRTSVAYLCPDGARSVNVWVSSPEPR